MSQMSQVPILINGQLLTTEDLNPREHQIFFRRMEENATGVKFHHVHIAISLNKIGQLANKAVEKVKAYAKNVYQESMMHYHEDNQYADTKRSEEYAIFVTSLLQMNQQNKLGFYSELCNPLQVHYPPQKQEFQN
jgi:hypothetical protein